MKEKYPYIGTRLIAFGVMMMIYPRAAGLFFLILGILIKSGLDEKWNGDKK